MIVFPVKFNKFRLKIMANTGKYFLQVVKNGLCEDAIAILCNKDQMGMKKENTVSSSTNVVDFFHAGYYRPYIGSGGRMSSEKVGVALCRKN